MFTTKVIVVMVLAAGMVTIPLCCWVGVGPFVIVANNVTGGFVHTFEDDRKTVYCIYNTVEMGAGRRLAGRPAGRPRPAGPHFCRPQAGRRPDFLRAGRRPAAGLGFWN